MQTFLGNFIKLKVLQTARGFLRFRRKNSSMEVVRQAGMLECCGCFRSTALPGMLSHLLLEIFLPMFANLR